MARILIIIAQENFRDEELNEPRRLLTAAGHEVIIASEQPGPCKGMLGMDTTADLSFADAKAQLDTFDLVVMVGGSGAPKLAENPDVIALLQQAKASAKPMGAICISPIVFAKAGVLEGKKATVFKTPDSPQQLAQGGATYVEEKVVVDGKLVTADGPHSATDFGRALLKLLE